MGAGREESVNSSFLRSLLGQIVEPWYTSLADPVGSQQKTLSSLLEGYAKSEYGQRYGADRIETIEEYRASFPVTSYQSLLSCFDQVKAGNYAVLLPEPAVRWVMTRGSTGKPKVIPATETHLSQILSVGARAVVNFALKKNPEVLENAVLNLNFPSEVYQFESPSGCVPYGYSSGTYAKLNPELRGARLVPRQEEIDSLGGGTTRHDWERRFELVYERASEVDLGSLIGVTPVMVSFANFVRRKYGLLPKSKWKPRALFCTSVAKIQTKYKSILQHFYGPAPVVEMYTATEGVFCQQLDDLPYVSPNYDVYLFEVATSRGLRMFHEMKPNEWGRVVVSTSMLPRYDIGDLVESLGKGYFRVFGRARTLTVLEHNLFNLISARWS
ncbi:MAG: GH3 auxin-responsive promoter family protein [Thaumarchaeota archaeon]|nr:GH3 auxin-responsive promoter family protein [Nitrososphaerota archaeon]